MNPDPSTTSSIAAVPCANVHPRSAQYFFKRIGRHLRKRLVRLVRGVRWLADAAHRAERRIAEGFKVPPGGG